MCFISFAWTDTTAHSQTHLQITQNEIVSRKEFLSYLHHPFITSLCTKRLHRLIRHRRCHRWWHIFEKILLIQGIPSEGHQCSCRGSISLILVDPFHCHGITQNRNAKTTVLYQLVKISRHVQTFFL